LHKKHSPGKLDLYSILQFRAKTYNTQKYTNLPSTNGRSSLHEWSLMKITQLESVSAHLDHIVDDSPKRSERIHSGEQKHVPKL